MNFIVVPQRLASDQQRGARLIAMAMTVDPKFLRLLLVDRLSVNHLVQVSKNDYLLIKGQQVEKVLDGPV
jgi:hypothetical protein